MPTICSSLLIALLLASSTVTLACLRVHRGGLLSASLLLLLREAVQWYGYAVLSLKFATTALLAGFRRMITHIPSILRISAHFHSLVLILHHSFKIPDGQYC